MPLGRIGAPFIYASDEHNTVTVDKTVQELKAGNWMHVTDNYAIFQQTAQPLSRRKNFTQINWCPFGSTYINDYRKNNLGAKKKLFWNLPGTEQKFQIFVGKKW